MPASEYLTAYGVSKRRSRRGKAEFTSGGREAAHDRVEFLAEKPRLHTYERKVFGNAKVSNVRIEAVVPLINLQQANGELTITPSPVLVHKIETFIVWKPADLYSQVVDEKERAKAIFIEYLLYLFEMNRRRGETAVYVVKRQMEAVTYALRMDALLDARQEKRVRDRLNKLYDYGKEIDYLKDYEVDIPGARYPKIDRLHLNNAKFKAPLQMS